MVVWYPSVTGLEGGGALVLAVSCDASVSVGIPQSFREQLQGSKFQIYFKYFIFREN